MKASVRTGRVRARQIRLPRGADSIDKGKEEEKSNVRTGGFRWLTQWHCLAVSGSETKT